MTPERELAPSDPRAIALDAASYAPNVPGPVRRATDAVTQALCAPRLSHDALRGAVVRYGAVTRDLALDPTEMLAALRPMVKRCVARLAPDEQAQVASWVQWWAIHGYHRAD
ncbi:MAG: hypothetical protein ACXWZS_07750 [Gemmatirosa sp.]